MLRIWALILPGTAFVANEKAFCHNFYGAAMIADSEACKKATSDVNKIEEKNQELKSKFQGTKSSNTHPSGCFMSRTETGAKEIHFNNEMGQTAGISRGTYRQLCLALSGKFNRFHYDHTLIPVFFIPIANLSYNI